MTLRNVIFGLLLSVLFTNGTYAQGKAALAKEAAEYVLRKFGREAADEGVETLTRKIETLAIRHGDDAIPAVKKVGPRVFRLIEEAGEHGTHSIKLMAKYGDDSIWIVSKQNRLAIFVKYGDDAAKSMIKHGEIAESLIQSLGKPGASALNAVSSQNARRLAMMADDGQLTKIGRTPELLEVVATYGDRAMDFIWKHKGALAVTAALTAFLANPEPFIDGTADITKYVKEGAVRPIAEEVGRRTNWTVVIVSGAGVFAVLLCIRAWMRHGRSSNEPKHKNVC